MDTEEGPQEAQCHSPRSDALHSTSDAVAEDSLTKDVGMAWAEPSMDSFVADSQQTPSETFETPPRTKGVAASATDGEGATSDLSAVHERGGASSIEEAQQSQEAPCLDQSERVLEQMRRCVLVHHQLSCLLIHNAALRAGLYGDHSNVDSQSPRGGEELEESIHHMGGSTARLFSMALRDRHDLEAMEDTLRQRVEEMVQAMRSEFQLAGCSAECSPLTTAHVLALAGAKDNNGTPRVSIQLKTPQSGNDEKCEGSPAEAEADEITQEAAAADSDAEAAKQAASAEAEAEAKEAEEAAAIAYDTAQAEVEATLRECQRLSTELASQQLHVARLREELRDVQRDSEGFHQSVTVACFDEVQRATDRNQELEEMLEQLTAYPQAHLHSRSGASRSMQAMVEKSSHIAGEHELAKESLVPSRRGPAESYPPGPPAMHVELEAAARSDGHQYVAAPPDPSGYVALQRPQAVVDAGARPRGRTKASGKAGMLTSPESLAQLDQQLRVSQSEFWGM